MQERELNSMYAVIVKTQSTGLKFDSIFHWATVHTHNSIFVITLCKHTLYARMPTHIYTLCIYICVLTRKCGKIRFMVFAPILVIPEVCRLARDWLQADQLPALCPYRLTYSTNTQISPE